MTRLMQNNVSLTTTIKDLSVLPYPKEIILDAILLELARGPSEHMTNSLSVGAISLAQYQPGVGEKPLKMLDVDEFPSANDEAAMTALIQRLARPEAEANKARFDSFNRVVEEDLKKINAKVAAARELGQAKTEAAK